MCGIVGYIGHRKALPLILEGLRRLEYRGYDSIGVLAYDDASHSLYTEKQPGRMQEFLNIVRQDAPGTAGIGHTRWATHGGVTRANAHPHRDCTGDIYAVHNGIIENFREIKNSLVKKGHMFTSETDTEVVPHLIEEFMKEGDEYEDAVMRALKTVRGSFALLLFNRSRPDTLIGARFSSPLILGTNNGEYMFASDAVPIALVTKEVLYLNDGDVVFATRNDYAVRSFLSETTENRTGTIDFKVEEEGKGGYETYMLKEIFEEPQAIENTLKGRIVLSEGDVKLGGLDPLRERLRGIDRLVLVACGTASYAAMVAEYFFEEYAELPTEVDLGSEYRYRKPILDAHTAVVAVSQSGETADTIAALKEAKTKGALTLGIVNVVGSSIARMVDGGVYSHAGPELAVASTKAFAAQVADLALLMVFLARQRKMSLVMGKRILSELSRIPEKMRTILGAPDAIRRAAAKYARYGDFLYLGRKYNYPIALEGNLKLKEVAYLHAEGYAAGEMKHGPIALIDKDFPSVVLAPKDSVYEKTISNMQEIRARGGKIIAVTTEGNDDLRTLADDVLFIPKTLEMLTPLLSVVPLHLFAYYAAKELGRDIDRPRNLAKSVTVE